MKKFVLAVVLFLLLFACGVWYQHTLSGFAREVDAYMQAIEEMTYAENQAALEQTFDALERYWEGKKTKMSYLVDHEHLHSLTRSIAELGMAIHAQAEADILMAGARVQKEASGIAGDELFLLQNIF